MGSMPNRLRLWDKFWHPIWDSDKDTTPPYRHIPDWVNATIDYPDGSREQWRFERCREGIRRYNVQQELVALHRLTTWPEPCLNPARQ